VPLATLQAFMQNNIEKISKFDSLIDASSLQGI
jgi:hypothetical protein